MAMFAYTKRTRVREIIVVLAVAVFMLPFFFLIVTALKNGDEFLNTSTMALPEHPTFENFPAAMSGKGTRSLWLGLANSLIITAGSLVVLIGLGSIAAYTISRLSKTIGAALSGVVLVGIILPAQLGIIPIYTFMRTAGLLGTHLGMVFLYAGLLMPLSVFLYAGFAKSLPRDYEEAAQIDGSGRFTTFCRIIFPLLSPATGTVAILAGLIIWNDFFNPLIFLSGSDAVTLPVVVYSLVGEAIAQWNVVFAAVILSMIPILAFYVFAQKRFIQGFAGGIK